jgi:hypothetical protein
MTKNYMGEFQLNIYMCLFSRFYKTYGCTFGYYKTYGCTFG